MRRKRLKLNTLSSIFFQITTIICGFILPRLILGRYGSAVNGLVNSINQFLQFIAFLELGVGAVVQSSLYKPLAEEDTVEISRIVKSAGKFFQKIAFALFFYVLILIAVFPLISDSEFDHFFSGTLIAAMSISFFAQYYFGVVDRLLLSSDQRGYIHYTAQAITLILNTVASAILIKMDMSIQVVKLTTSLIYLIRPMVLRIYVNQNYTINRKIVFSGEPIKQKWNGIAQHIAAIVLDGTDIIVLTLLSSFSNVSIYSVYYLVVNGVKQLFISMTNGIQALMGDMWARNEQEQLNRTFDFIEWIIHTGAVFVFGCTLVLLLPFVGVYTKGINDINYLLPLFGLLITIANASHCLRLPYNIMILAVGHYKETQHNYIIAALINVVSSVLLVKLLGLVGVAIGTLIAMVYQTIWMAFYCYKKLLIKESMSSFWKQVLVDVVTFALIIVVAFSKKFNVVSYFGWFLLAVKVVLLLGTVVLLLNIFFYKNEVERAVKMISNRVTR